MAYATPDDRESTASLDHAPDDLERLANLRASVDVVAEEDHLAVRVTVEAISVAVNVADDVVFCITFPPKSVVAGRREYFQPLIPFGCP